MTILEPTLYANGALRITRHGAGRGGNVLLLVDDGTGHSKQVSVPDSIIADVERYIAIDTTHGLSAATAFELSVEYVEQYDEGRYINRV